MEELTNEESTSLAVLKLEYELKEFTKQADAKILGLERGITDLEQSLAKAYILISIVIFFSILRYSSVI